MVALGGALGSVLRYVLTLLALTMQVDAKWSTLVANVCGSFLIGFISPAIKSEYLLLWSVGLCGGFTTMSTFSSQSMQLFRDGQYGMGLLYIGATIVLCLCMVALGWYCREKML